MKKLNNTEELNKIGSSFFSQYDSLLESYLHLIQEEGKKGGIFSKAKDAIKYVFKSADTVHGHSTLYQKAPLAAALVLPGSNEALGLTFFSYNYMKNMLSKYAEECKKRHQDMSTITKCIDEARRKMFQERIQKLHALKPKCIKTKNKERCLQKIDEMTVKLEDKIKNIKVLIF